MRSRHESDDPERHQRTSALAASGPSSMTSKPSFTDASQAAPRAAGPASVSADGRRWALERAVQRDVASSERRRSGSRSRHVRFVIAQRSPGASERSRCWNWQSNADPISSGSLTSASVAPSDSPTTNCMRHFGAVRRRRHSAQPSNSFARSCARSSSIATSTMPCTRWPPKTVGAGHAHGPDCARRILRFTRAELARESDRLARRRPRASFASGTT